MSTKHTPVRCAYPECGGGCAECQPLATSTQTFTKETIQATRQWYADNALACIAEVRSGAVLVNDPEAYFLECRQHHADALAGKWDHTLSFRQKARFIQTGECVPLLLPAIDQGASS